MQVALLKTAMVVAASWQIVFAPSALATLGPAGWPLALMSAVLGVYGFRCSGAAARGPSQVVPVAMAALGVAGMLVVDEPEQLLTIASCWQVDFATCVAGMVIASRWVLGAVPTLAVAFVVLAPSSPAWPPGFAVAVAVAQVAIIFATRCGVALITGVARRVDRSEQEAQAAARGAAAAGAAAAVLAEEARTLHDTALNTLDAIAAGGAAISDPAIVEKQCLRDIEFLQDLRRPRDSAEAGVRLMDVVELSALPVRLSGLDRVAMRDVEGHLDDGTRTAAAGVLREALTNAAKHSQAPEVHITFSRSHDRLRMVVADSGVGFDAGAQSAGTGLGESMQARARSAGISVSVRSRPGQGTTVDILVPMAAAPGGADQKGPPPGERPIATVQQVLRRGSLAWAAGVTLVGVALTLTGEHRAWPFLWPMLIVMALSCFVAYAVPDSSRAELPVIVGLTAAAIVVFVLSAAATDFGGYHAAYWPALSATAPLVCVMFSLYGSPRASAIVAAVCLMGLALVTLFAARSSILQGAITAAAGAVAVVFGVAWFQFQRVIARISAAGRATQAKLFDAQIEIAARDAANDTHRLWLDAGLDATIELLRGVVDRELDPRDETVRARCQTEAAFLRQIILLRPASLHLGRELVPVIESSRQRGVVMRVQLGDLDVPSAVTAAQIAEVVRLVADAQVQGDSMTVSVFPSGESVELTMVASSIKDTAHLADLLLRHGWEYEMGAGFVRATPVVTHREREPV